MSTPASSETAAPHPFALGGFWPPSGWLPRHPSISPSTVYAVFATDGGVRFTRDSGIPVTGGERGERGAELAGMLKASLAVPRKTNLRLLDQIAAHALILPRGDQWREALGTALIGGWCDDLWSTGYLPTTALGKLKDDARTLHRQLVPLWRRRTRHGRVLSLDADLGGGLSLHDLVAADVDLLGRVAGRVYEDERLKAVLRGLDPVEQQVVFAYAAGQGVTWAEAAASAVDPEAFGERVRRKVKRLAAEQRRRAAQRRNAL
ncbi:hypothetical protein OHA02_52185 [Streptomyces phaeochromogenes]|nr:hypothetical protein [Streptomyces phaeochromogenes]